ncbi:fungal specific transcription factor domain-containing protein [Ilyonectria robusta]
MTCSSIGGTHKSKEPRQRVLISHQYERKIDLIEERLDGIEDALWAIAAGGTIIGSNRVSQRSAAPSTASRSLRSVHPQAAQTEVEDEDEDESDSVVGVDQTLTAQAAFACNFLENAIRRHTSLNDLPPDMQSALSSLRQMVSTQNNFYSTRDFKLKLQVPMPPGGLQGLPIPPMKIVVSLLQMQKSTPTPDCVRVAAPPGMFSVACAFVDLDKLLELCRRVYFRTDSFSHASFIILNGSLYYFLADQIYLAEAPAVKAEMEEYRRICQANLETALSTLPLMMPVRQASISALLIATCYAISLSKLSLAWHYNSNAAKLCQILGYHRSLPCKAKKSGYKDVRSLLFWNAYMLDRTLAARLGLPAVIQNWNIMVPRKIDSSIIEDPWGPIMTNWLEEADLAYQVYELLYSPAALAKPEAERTMIARRLQAEQLEIMAAASEIRERALFGLREANASELIDVYLRGNEISYRSTWVLIHLAIPTVEDSLSRFTAEFLDSARFALLLHRDMMQALELEREDLKVVFVHWTILLQPFAPFFALFCYVVETCSTEDLRRLFQFVELLRPVCDFSESILKFHKLCQLLCNVGQAYCEARVQETPSGVPINRDFDMYLSSLGPPMEMLMQVSRTDTPMEQPAMQTEHLGTLFSGSQQKLWLLEEDISQFHEAWMQ